MFSVHLHTLLQPSPLASFSPSVCTVNQLGCSFDLQNCWSVKPMCWTCRFASLLQPSCSSSSSSSLVPFPHLVSFSAYVWLVHSRRNLFFFFFWWRAGSLIKKFEMSEWTGRSIVNRVGEQVLEWVIVCAFSLSLISIYSPDCLVHFRVTVHLSTQSNLSN